MAEKSLLWLMYRRTRVGIAFAGFILMYAVYTGTFGITMALVALSVFFAELFGACYNDSQDFKEDVDNQRYDKLTVSDILTVSQMKFVSVLMFFGSLVTSIFSGFVLPAGVYLFMAWAYSYSGIRLKRYHLKGYVAAASTWLIIPVYLGLLFRGGVTKLDIFFSMFFFFQYTYLLSQKDSTDAKDRTNLFIEHGWSRAASICGFLALVSSSVLLMLSFGSAVLFFAWMLNFAVKIYQMNGLYTKKITREIRGNCTLMEFLTPYVYLGSSLIV